MRLAVYLRGLVGLLVFLFLVEEENNVGNVGCVALSENFLLGFLWGLFGLGYIPYIPYIVLFFYDKEEY